jgi:hypothetical protein
MGGVTVGSTVGGGGKVVVGVTGGVSVGGGKVVVGVTEGNPVGVGKETVGERGESDDSIVSD